MKDADIAEYEADLLTCASEECLKVMIGSLELNDENHLSGIKTVP